MGGAPEVKATVTLPWPRVLLLVVAGLIAGCLLVEAVVRAVTHSGFAPGGPNSDRYIVWDPAIGRMPRPGLSFRHPKGFSISTGEYSTRSNGSTPPRAQRPLVLAVGDSFAFGDEVNDEDSWPAVLERLSGLRVINAGVPGFGLDQAVLRAEQLSAVYRPEVIVAGIIPHDVLRCGMSYWSGRPKPYFEIDGSGLRLHPPVVPPPSEHALLKRVLSYSVAMDLLFPRFLHWEGPEEEVAHDQSMAVACRLMERLAALGKARKALVVVLVHPQVPDSPPQDLAIKDGVLGCARASHLAALDLFPAIDSLVPEGRSRLFRGHLTVEGNRLVASELNRFLRAEIPGVTPSP